MVFLLTGPAVQTAGLCLCVLKSVLENVYYAHPHQHQHEPTHEHGTHSSVWVLPTFANRTHKSDKMAV